MTPLHSWNDYGKRPSQQLRRKVPTAARQTRTSSESG
jgi:hypothetical protein